ncbi:unnamed protein product [Didymodactylos carnosus]|uniref:SWIM-type domain-containing protein n=1 Tax=Didymodactylos carnosus TaxID=1234261 RepID=A0A8S2JAJ7_9BILA|nr:unnamed protein product [Didymodactylos carnosus]CAF3798940.1 unnamed protein product [Didymodactylos carnosus]
MEAMEVAQYESDISDEEMSEEQCAKNGNKRHRIKKKNKFWIKETTFNNAGEAEASLRNDWSKHYTNRTHDGKRVYYRCRKVRRRDPPCSASISLLYHADSDKVTIRKKYGSYIISLGELEQWCQDNSNVPANENTAFVVSYKILYDVEEDEEDEEDDEDVDDTSGKVFRLFISSVRLLSVGSVASHINADATYKLVWQGFPVLVIGTTDRNKAFHPLGLAVCSNEKKSDFQFIFNAVQMGMQKIGKNLLKPEALVCDAAPAIKNGFTKVFEMENNSHWKTSKCDCPAFLKNYICKHVAGMSIRLKYCKPPAAAKTVPIGEKRKRGRPAKAKPALLVQ